MLKSIIKTETLLAPGIYDALSDLLRNSPEPKPLTFQELV